MGSREDRVQPLTTCRPLSHANDPWLHPGGEDGWGGGGGAVLLGQARHTCAHAPLNALARHTQVSGCLGERWGGKDRAEQTPPQLPPQGLPVSGLRLQSPLPQP